MHSDYFIYKTEPTDQVLEEVQLLKSSIFFCEISFQVMSQEIQEQLHKQQEVIADKQMSVKEDLDKVEPAVIEAQNGMLAPQEITLWSWI